MDVNPQFTNGPTGMEFTTELTTFELLNVKLVHGWLLDPQSEEEYRLIDNKTYNELVEFVIHGNEASAELHKLEEQIKKLESCSDDDWIDIGVPADTIEDDTTTAINNSTDIASTNDTDKAANNNSDDPNNNTAGEQNDDAQDTPSPPQPPTPSAPPAPTPLKTIRQSVGEMRATFREKEQDLSKKATLGSLINNFLDHTGHQLTQYGLSILYEHLSENELCVFFRNNHFSTITKHEGLLYLLVTDLGYANVPNVVWEKLDVIDGDTEYVNATFAHPAPHAQLSAEHQSNEGGYSNLDPEQLIAQRGQHEADYQLALQLSGMNTDSAAAAAGGGGGNTSNANNNNRPANLDEQEGQLMAAATEASLRTYNGVDDGIAGQKQMHHDNNTTQEDRDHLLAMQMQAEMEDQDARLAQQMQRTEWAEQRQTRQNATATTAPAAKQANCVIS